MNVARIIKTVSKYTGILPKNARVNFAELGYYRPSGEMIFPTEKAAMKYAEKRAISALKEPEPFERGVLVCKNRVLGEFNGDCEKVQIELKDGLLKNSEKYSVIHGHPNVSQDGVTTPISLADYYYLSSNKACKEVIAYNTNGEFSKLIQLPPPKMPWETTKLEAPVKLDIKNFFKNYKVKKFEKENYTNKFDNIKSSKIKEATFPKYKLYEILFSNSELNNKYLKTLLNAMTKEERAALDNAKALNDKEKAIDIILNFQLSDRGIQAIHKFWQENSNIANVEYTTNFAHLA